MRKVRPSSYDARSAAARSADLCGTAAAQIIASRLLDSKLNSPHVYVSRDVPLDAALAYRKQLAAGGLKVSVNDLVVKAAALALVSVKP